MYDIFHYIIMKQNLNIMTGILPQSVLQNHLSAYGLTLPICRMQAEFEHVIHQKYLHDKANMPVQFNMNAERSVKQVLTHLPQQTCVICMAWPGEEPK